MNIYKLMKILSNKSQLRIIAHLYDCKCHQLNTSSLQNKIGISQTLISKFLRKLLDEKIITFKMLGKNKHYIIDNNFKLKWEEVIRPIIKNKEMESYKCQCKH